MSDQNYNLNSVKTFLINLQTTITSTLTKIDGKENFTSDVWDRPEGGGGESMILKDGAIF